MKIYIIQLNFIKHLYNYILNYLNDSINVISNNLDEMDYLIILWFCIFFFKYSNYYHQYNH